MEMSGEYRINASRQAVWDALNDPEVLKACIPGCEELEQKSPNELAATVTAKVGPVKAKFKGEVTLENLNPPESYTIAGEGKGGVAGFAKGGADVALQEDGDGTLLNYTAKAQVGGKLAQLGSRLIDSTAKKMADQFFEAFAEKVGGPVAEAAASAEEEAADAAPEPVSEPAEAVAKAVPDAPAAEAAASSRPADSAAEAARRTVEQNVQSASSSGGVPSWVYGLAGLVIIAVIALYFAG